MHMSQSLLVGRMSHTDHVHTTKERSCAYFDSSRFDSSFMASHKRLCPPRNLSYCDWWNKGAKHLSMKLWCYSVVWFHTFVGASWFDGQAQGAAACLTAQTKLECTCNASSQSRNRVHILWTHVGCKVHYSNLHHSYCVSFQIQQACFNYRLCNTTQAAKKLLMLLNRSGIKTNSN